MLKPVIDPVTHAKFSFLPYDVHRDHKRSKAAGPSPAAPSSAPGSAGAAATPSQPQGGQGQQGLQGRQQVASSVQEDERAEEDESEGEEGCDGERQSSASGELFQPEDEVAVAAEPTAATAAGTAAAGSVAGGAQKRDKKGSVLRRKLEALCGTELTAWLLREMDLTRAWDAGKGSKAPKPRPIYDLKQLRQYAEQGMLGVLAGTYKDKPEMHSHFGSTQMLAYLAANPAVLWPAGLAPNLPATQQ